MAMIDKDNDRRSARAERETLAGFLRYPQDRIDFGYEVSTPFVQGKGRRPGPEGLSLVARVYE